MSKINIGLIGNQHVKLRKSRKDPLYGAIAGDIIGSRFEFNNHRSKNFRLFAEDCEFTDDTVMSLAIYKATKEFYKYKYTIPYSEYVVKVMRDLGRQYPNLSYGGNFSYWLHQDSYAPYNSYGNGAPMRISGIFACEDAHLGDVYSATLVTHNHSESIKAVHTLYRLMYDLYNTDRSEPIESLDFDWIPYDLNFSLDDIRDTYEFDETCQGTMPVSIKAFLESKSFIDAIRNAISIGGDSDTIACITGSIAGAYYGVPLRVKNCVHDYLDKKLLNILNM